MVKYLRISSYIRKPFLIYDFATDPILISLYMMENFGFFLSVYARANPWCTYLSPQGVPPQVKQDLRHLCFTVYARVKEWTYMYTLYNVLVHTWVNVSQGDVFSSMQYKPEATNALNGTASG